MIALQGIIKNAFYSEDYEVQKYDIEQFSLYKLLGDYYFINEKYQLAYNQYSLAKRAFFLGCFKNSNFFDSETNSWDIITSDTPSDIPLDFISNNMIDIQTIFNKIRDCESRLL
jgi:hypothetical protein